MSSRPKRRPWATGAFVAVLLSLVAVPAAGAAPTWLTPVNVGPTSTVTCLPGNYVCDTDIGAAPDGTAILAAVNYDPANANKRRAYVSIRKPGAGFGAIKYLSPADADVSGVNGHQIDLAVDSSGGATAVWAYHDGGTGTDILQAAYRRPGATTFGDAQTISTVTHNASFPTVAVSNNGGAVVTWRDEIGGNATVKSRFRTPGALTFSGPADDISSASTTLSDPKVVMAPNGAAAAIWVRSGVVEAILRPAGAAFNTATRTTLSGNPGTTPDIAISPSGRTTAVWNFDPNTGVSGDEIIQSKETTAAGAWPPSFVTPDTLTVTGERGANPAVAVDSGDNAVAVWNGTLGGVTKVRAATRASGGSFTNQQPISSPGSSPFAPQVALAPNGDAIATWSLYDGSNETVQTSRKPVGQNFGGVDVIMQGSSSSTPSSSTFKGVWFRPPPRVAFDNEGNGFATWIGYTSFFSSVPCCTSTNSNYVQVAGFDAAPPRFTAVNVPTAGTTGAAIPMGAAALDRLSSLTMTWSFGDGAAGSGSAPSHAYGAPGTYTVTVTARDAVGNATSQSRTVQITSPSSGGGGGGGVDNDGDGFFAGQDCNDNNAKINPSAKEIRGNNIDEDCNGVASLLPDLRSSVVPTWSVAGSKSTAVGFLLKGLKRGWTVTASCKGTGCPFKSKKIKNKKVKKGQFNALKKLGSKRTFKAGSKLTVKFTARGYNTKFSIFKFKNGKIPSGVAKCQTKGTNRLRACR